MWKGWLTLFLIFLQSLASIRATRCFHGSKQNRGPFGTYTSGGHPMNYPHNEDCYYTVYAQTGPGFNGINLNFVTFEIEQSKNCKDDHLVVYEYFEGEKEEWGDSKVKYMIEQKDGCGKKEPFSINVKQGKNLQFHFVTDDAGNAKGWLMNWKPICNTKYFGNECKRCNCKNDLLCNKVTGACPMGCAPNHKGIDCWTRFCHGPLFGPKCDKMCHCKNNVPCDLFNGTCPGGKCDDSWTSNFAYGANCVKELDLSIVPSQFAMDSSFTVKCSADAIDMPKDISKVLELTLQGPKNSDGSDNELAFLSFKSYLVSKTTNPREVWKTMKEADNLDFTFPTKAEMDEIDETSYTNSRKALKISLLVNKASFQDAGLYTCYVTFVHHDGTKSTDNREQLTKIVDAGRACTKSNNVCPATDIAYTGDCDENLHRCLCTVGYARIGDRCDATGLKCSRDNNECPDNSWAYTGECNERNFCTCSEGFDYNDGGCDVPGLRCSKAGKEGKAKCPRDHKAYTGDCGDANRCTCNEGFIARGKSCTAPGLECNKDRNSCPNKPNEGYTGECGDNSRCTCAEGFFAIDGRCQVPGLPCSTDEKAIGTQCPVNNAYTGKCDKTNNRCTCKDGYVKKYKSCEEGVAGMECTMSNNICPANLEAYTGDCDEKIKRCICNVGYNRIDDRCEAAGWRCSREDNDCPSSNHSKAYTGECNKEKRCTCSDGYDYIDQGCEVPGMQCGNEGNADCPADEAYTGECGNRKRCTCREGSVAKGKNCIVPGHKCKKDWNTCKDIPDEGYSGECGENSRCACAEGFTAIDDRCDVPGLPCKSDVNAPCPTKNTAYTGNCDKRSNRCTCKDGYVVKYKGCQEPVDRPPDQAMARNAEAESFILEGVVLSIVIGLVQGIFCLGVYVYVKRKKNQYHKPAASAPEKATDNKPVSGHNQNKAEEAHSISEQSSNTATAV